jgi:hypothetical protein
MTDPQWAVTMFSYTTELVLGRRTPQQVLLDAADAGVASRFEMDGFQHFTSFPEVSDEEAEGFRDDIARRGIELTEIGLYDDRFFVDEPGSGSMDSRVDLLTRQIDSAGRLGFPAVKLMFGADLELLDRLRPALDRHGLALYQEAQGALRAGSPELDRQLAYASAYPDTFGFVFDLSACMYGAPVTYLEELRRLGVPQEAVDLIESDWPTDRNDAVKDRVLAITRDLLLDPAARMRLMMPFGRFGNSKVSEFHDLISIARIVHLKFWDLVDEGGIVSDPIRDLHRELAKIGYAGPITSEWGGHEWLEGPEYDPDLVTQQHRGLYLQAIGS